MLPVSDDDSSRRNTPVVTYGLIALNVIFFLIELSQGDAFIERWAFVPTRFLAHPESQFPTLFTSMFMHAGWVHILGNMLYLWIFGDNVEDRFGAGNFLIFYLLCGLGATFTQLAFSANSNIPNLGASGAIAGVLGSYILMFPKSRVSVLTGNYVVPMSAFVVIGLWFVLQLFSGIATVTSAAQTGGVAYMAHIGGFVTGLVLTYIFSGGRRALPAGY